MPPEEQMILQWLCQYEVMTLDQAISLLSHKTKSVANKIIRGMRKQHRSVRCRSIGQDR